MKDTKKLSIFGTLLLYAILVTIWGIRLEGRVDSNTDDITVINKEIIAYHDFPLNV